MPLGVAVPVCVRVGVLRLPVCLVSSGRGLAWRPAAVAGWVMGLGGGTAGWGDRRVELCGAQGSWGAVVAAGVGVPTLVEWGGGVCVRGWALGDVPQADAVSLRLLKGPSQEPEDIWVVLGCGEVAGGTPRGWSASASMASDAACRIQPPAGWRRRFSADPLRGRWTRPSREGSARAHFRSSRSCVWVQRCHDCPWAGPWPWAEEWAWVGVMWFRGLVAVAGLGDSWYSCALGTRGEWGRGRMWTRGYARTVSASGLGWDSPWRR